MHAILLTLNKYRELLYTIYGSDACSNSEHRKCIKDCLDTSDHDFVKGLRTLQVELVSNSLLDNTTDIINWEINPNLYADTSWGKTLDHTPLTAHYYCNVRDIIWSNDYGMIDAELKLTTTQLQFDIQLLRMADLHHQLRCFYCMSELTINTFADKMPDNQYIASIDRLVSSAKCHLPNTHRLFHGYINLVPCCNLCADDRGNMVASSFYAATRQKRCLRIQTITTRTSI